MNAGRQGRSERKGQALRAGAACAALAALIIGACGAEADEPLRHGPVESTAGHSAAGARGGLGFIAPLDGRDAAGVLLGPGRMAEPAGVGGQAGLAWAEPASRRAGTGQGRAGAPGGAHWLAIGSPSPSPPERRGNARALLAALMSAAVPGAGQLRNGAVLRGLGYFVLEVSGWVAYGAFRQSSREKRDEYAAFAGRHWDYERYHTRAPDPDSCSVYGCPSGMWSQPSDDEIAASLESANRDRFYEYATRDAYACGWDSPDSRSIYRGLWKDRESALEAKRWTGRAIFLNHLVSAADAFIGARSLGLDLGERTQVRMHLRGSPLDVRPEVRLTHRF
ncbi:MAG: hypothetical protein FJY75_03605 [Candidatus Eisenbacteria bacterium]|uniref:DUF5683 domain-containing protein n=1 Tax=Eiseniibacteriota bacterium TaxID=2212470 RepID=A0A937XBK2_UNCEI|nr:hypothetical protein [Candidatus Eisenbacteria bacterium]